MGIWIRSQDKKSLLLCKSFDVGCNNDNYNILVNYELRNNEEHYSPMGNYSSVEKAVKVLGMIQTEIIKSNNMILYEISEINYFIFSPDKEITVGDYGIDVATLEAINQQCKELGWI